MTWTMKKEKNLIRIIRDEDGKFYETNINTGVIHGLNGKPLQKRFFPSNLKEAFQELYSNENETNLLLQALYLTEKYDLARRAKALSFIDKINSLELVFFNPKDFAYFFTKDLFSRTSFKKVAREIKKLEELQEEYEAEQIYNLLFEQEQIAKFGNYPKEYYRVFEMFLDRNPNCEKFLPLVAHYLSQGLLDFFYDKAWSVVDRLDELFAKAKEMNYVPQKQNFIKEWSIVARNYELYKKEQSNKKLQEKQLDIFHYENSLFTVVVPKTVEELIKEGQDQKNCVGSYGRTISERKSFRVVFIRSKINPEKSYITASFQKGCDTWWYSPEENANSYIYDQFLGKCNQEPQEEDILAFKKEYLDYLNSNCL